MESNFEIAVGIAKIVSAIGTLIIAVLAVWGDKFRPGPKLVIEDHNIEGEYCNLSDGTSSYYYHLKVKNLRKYVTAKNVRILLVGIKRKLIDGTFSDERIKTYSQFVFTPAELSPISPSVKDYQLFDFGRIVDIQSNRRFEPTFYIIPINFNGFVSKNESVRYLLKIFADNYSSDYLYEYEISYDGQWDSSRENMKKHLVIKKIK